MQPLINDVDFTAPIIDATLAIETTKDQKRNPITAKNGTSPNALTAPKLVKIPFQSLTGSAIALEEACPPSEIGQHLASGRSSFVGRPVFRGQDFTVTATRAGRFVDFHGAEPFRISKSALSLLQSKTRLHKQFLEGDEVTLACRYMPSLDHHVDIFQNTLLREGKVLYRDHSPSVIGEPITHRPFNLDINTSDPREAFKLETDRILSEIADGNPFLLPRIDAILWFPHGLHQVETLQTVRVDIPLKVLKNYR